MALLAVATRTTAGVPFAGTVGKMTFMHDTPFNEAPNPELTYTLNGNTITVNASDSYGAGGGIVQYNWDFGDGAKATGVTATHQYTSSGSYLLTLTVIDHAGGAGITQQQLYPGVLFYWSVDKLPMSTPIISDVGNVPISRYSNDATLVSGVKGNAFHQTDSYQMYSIPNSVIPVSKGTIKMYVKFDNAPSINDTQKRFLFATSGANIGPIISALEAYTYKKEIYFQISDSKETTYYVSSSNNWQVGKWYLYEFSWDASAGILSIKRDGIILNQSQLSPWNISLINWSNRTFLFGGAQFSAGALNGIQPVGSFDEIYITD